MSSEARAQRILTSALTAYRDRIVLACSFGGASGMVLVDLLARTGRTIPVYYLDTGLLFAETHELVERVRVRYGIEAFPVRPQLELPEQAERYGDELWARDPDACCALRKVVPQRRFLAKYGAWITGLRRDQSQARASVRYVDWDARSGGLAKISPLADWSEADVWAYVVRHDVPYNALHDRDYPSIGCIPCTLSVAAGQPARAGRWSGFTKTECGLHAATTAAAVPGATVVPGAAVAPTGLA